MPETWDILIMSGVLGGTSGFECWGVGHDKEIKVVKWVLVNKTKTAKKRKIFVKVFHSNPIYCSVLLRNTELD